MKKIKKFLNMLKNSVIMQGVFCVICLTFIFLLYKPVSDIVISSKPITVDYNVISNIETVQCEEGKIKISGWVIRNNSKNRKVKLVLEPSTQNKKNIVIDARLKEDKNISNFFFEGSGCDAERFEASFSGRKIDKDECYRINLFYEVETKDSFYQLKFFSNKFLYQNELFSYDPITFIEPEITDSELLNVIENGEVKGYDKKYQLWIYQLDNLLYFIVNPSFGSMEQAVIGIPVMPKTSRVEQLPEHRVQYELDHLGYYFENLDYQRIGVLPYQIVRVPLSTEYPNTYVITGLYDNVNEEWVSQFYLPVAGWSYHNSKEK